MANRAYLYATDRHPAEAASPETPDSSEVRIVGLSEAAYLVPLSYLLLLTGEPQVCPSLIWDDAPVGIIGDYDAGLARLTAFLDRLAEAEPHLRDACDGTRTFLTHPATRRKYLVLETGELFDMTDAPHERQAAELIDEIQSVDADVEAFLRAVARRGTYGGDSADARTDRGMGNALRWSGVGYWSHVLYYDFGPEEHADGAQDVDAFMNLDPPAPAVTTRPAMPFWTPLVGTAVLVLSVILTGHAPLIPGPGWFAVGFLSLYAVATALCTLVVWGVWWRRHGRNR